MKFKHKKIIIALSMCITCMSASASTEKSEINPDILGEKLPESAKQWDHYSDNGDSFYDKKDTVDPKVKTKIKSIFKDETQKSFFEENRVLITVDDRSSLTKNYYSKQVIDKVPKDPTSGMDGNLSYSRVLVKYNNKEGGETILTIDNSKVKSLKDINGLFKSGLDAADKLLENENFVTVELAIQTNAKTKDDLKRTSSKIINLSKGKDGSILAIETISLNTELPKDVKVEKSLSLDSKDVDMENSSFWSKPSIK